MTNADTAEAGTDDGPPRRRFELDDRGFNEVPKKWRKFYRHWEGAGDSLAPNEIFCPVCKGHPRRRKNCEKCEGFGKLSRDSVQELVGWVRTEIGPIASPDAIQFTPALPKTRSGKIMRRILRKIAEGDVSSLGDTSTLAEPAVVDELVANRVG